MNEHNDIFTVKAMARVLGVSRSGYYAWLGRPRVNASLKTNFFLKRSQSIFKPAVAITALQESTVISKSKVSPVVVIALLV